MLAFIKLGVKVAQTELDICLDFPVNATNTKQQTKDYYDTVKACVDVKGCVGTTVWDFDDKVRVSVPRRP
jgi:endo-1,4-beta-xylanase